MENHELETRRKKVKMAGTNGKSKWMEILKQKRGNRANYFPIFFR
jgi:hypothetical protein